MELGTSHQLLSFHLKGLNDWQRKEYKRQAQAIRNQADAEDRFLTPWEESQIRALDHAAFCCMIDGILQPMFDRWEANAEASTLSKQELKCITLFAQKGIPIAQEILKKYRNNLPPVENGGAKSFKST